MPYLGDYLGQIASEITMARMHADLESVRLAELYASHPLLRTMPVPHLRLPEVELDIPVLIKASEEPRAGESARGGIDKAAMVEAFNKTLDEHLAKAGIKLPDIGRKKLQAILAEHTPSRGALEEIAVNVNRLADDMTAAALKVVAEHGPRQLADSPSPLAAGLSDAVRLEFLKLRTAPPRLSVMVTSAELREANAGNLVTRLHLKLTEQGLEWTSTESESGPREQLVPE